MQSKSSRIWLAGCLASVLALSLGCSKDPQGRYEEAAQALQAARAERNAAQAEVREKKQELEQLRAHLEQAEQRLAKAREHLEAAAVAVDKSVSDEVLFRTIQRELLDKDRFEDAAIAVGVDDRVVTLTGTVPDEATREQALKAARDHAGVEEVVDFLEIEDSAQNN